ncbi:alpha/beta fold hydrolase [Blastococcus sp. KM273128]|uniref:alpha/beta fold hydrolase n=1 Tax=Blastococcus sp. KM273128 TaxID=2570314 RepID=UPI001F2EFAF8|nr:alpha/beta fold hydrolase [Blastococcus sp. KM273128]MCF6746544.1 alpha/beta fold hydrolase [Blastococcus sp. KM273128]
MSGAPVVAGIEVHGGAGGVEADLADLVALAGSSLALAEALAATSAACHAVLVDPDLLASALLDPVAVARFQAALLTALDGPGGLTALAVSSTARAGALRSAAGAYAAADAALAALVDDLHRAAGFVPEAALAGLLLAGAGQVVTDPVGAAVAVGELSGDPERWLTEHPGVVDHLVSAAPGTAARVAVGTGGVLSPWLGGGDVRSAAARLGRLWPDGVPVVARRPDDLRPAAVRPPRGAADLLAALHLRSAGSGADGDEVGVRVLTRADGTTAYVVDIPGTGDWSLPDGSVNPASNDLGTNLRVLGGEVTTRQRAVAEALRRSGAGPSDPVLLVGHSQGGMVAAQAAHDAGTADFPYDVRGVLTAGAPIGRVEVPSRVQVLALENAHDVVAHLDGRDNDDDPNVTTVTFARSTGAVATAHGLASSYLPGARAVDRVEDPSLAAFRASAAPFLAGPGEEVDVVSHVYAISRG